MQNPIEQIYQDKDNYHLVGNDNLYDTKFVSQSVGNKRLNFKPTLYTPVRSEYITYQ